jgi:hypothetical protein
VAELATIRRPVLSSNEPETIEILDAGELATRLKLPKSWVEENCRTRALDPIPHLRLGKYRRFKWGSRELTQWLERRMNGTTIHGGR